MAQREEGLWQAWLRLETATAAEHFARGGMALEQRFVGAFEHYVTAVGTRARAEIHDVVGHADHLLMVLHEQHRVARIAQPLHGMLHELYVVVVQARAGFVEDVEYVGERRVDVFRNLAPLCLASRQRAHAAVEAEVAQSDFLKRCQAGADGRLQVVGQRVADGGNPLVQLCDAHGACLSDVHSVDFTGEHALTQAGAAAVGTSAHAQHRIEHGGMQQAFLGVDDGAIHTRDEALVLRRFRPVGRRVLQANLRTVEEEVEFLGRVVANLLVEVEESTVGIANPSPSSLAEGDVVDGVFIVQAFVEVHEFVDIELANLAQSRTARTAALGMIERE